MSVMTRGVRYTRRRAARVKEQKDAVPLLVLLRDFKDVSFLPLDDDPFDKKKNDIPVQCKNERQREGLMQPRFVCSRLRRLNQCVCVCVP